MLLPILLVVVGLVFAYLGITTFQNATAEVSVLGLDISASDEGGQTTAIVYFVLAAICLFGGIGLYRKAA
ncbi:MAG: hypothetical protein D6772_08585 [Bacteroidetes bacterium]|nr:MAG: hypothetical protein D6772_08585 [Bacteroidota bacterium]